MSAASMINCCGLCFHILAAQNEKTGIITLIGYVGLVYSFLGDSLIFNETFKTVEVTAIMIILALNIAIVYKRLTGENSPKPIENKIEEEEEQE